MDSGFYSDFVKMIGILILCIGAIFALLFLLRRLQSRYLYVGGTPQVRLIHSITIAPKRSVAIVEIAGKWLVLGVGSESVRLLKEMDPPEEQTDPPESQSIATSGIRRMIDVWASGRGKTSQK